MENDPPSPLDLSDEARQLIVAFAHDFNNLLTPIVGGLEMIAMREEDARLKRIAEIALEAARRGPDLTRRLLEQAGMADSRIGHAES